MIYEDRACVCVAGPKRGFVRPQIKRILDRVRMGRRERKRTLTRRSLSSLASYDGY